MATELITPPKVAELRTCSQPKCNSLSTELEQKRAMGACSTSITVTVRRLAYTKPQPTVLLVSRHYQNRKMHIVQAGGTPVTCARRCVPSLAHLQHSTRLQPFLPLAFQTQRVLATIEIASACVSSFLGLGDCRRPCHCCCQCTSLCLTRRPNLATAIGRPTIVLLLWLTRKTLPLQNSGPPPSVGYMCVL